MSEVLFDNPELNFPPEWDDVKYDPFKRIIERMSARIGGPSTDTIDTIGGTLSGATDSISLLTLKVANLELLTATPKNNNFIDKKAKYSIWGLL